ncbi:hypothetical protein DVH24_024933 [Malus domestica]|uniref:Uncharacterized protein n=1 Tax=Malus domestica TaxID=3750 RepID=A0A498JHB6_MALDO|nr:hypothetical protein DVH24_024933 [Malus domestica]
MTTLVTYGILQEKIMRVPYDDDKAFFKYSLFLVFCNRIMTSAVSAEVLWARKKALDPGREEVGEGKRWGMRVGRGRLGGQVEKGFWVLVAVEEKKKVGAGGGKVGLVSGSSLWPHQHLTEKVTEKLTDV